MLAKIDKRKVAIHFVVPMAVMGALLAMCFSGVYILEMIVVMPHLEGVAPPSRRELGLLENLQNALIIGVIVVAVRAAIKADAALVRLLFGFITAVSVFMLLEEMDYGLHYYEFVAGIPPDEAAEVRNIHNQGISTPLKTTGDILLILAFVVAPLALRRARNPWVRYLTPHPYFLLTMLCAFITSRIGHSLEHVAVNISFAKNIGEFRETVTYYIALLYVLELSRRNPPARVPSPTGGVPAPSP